ncbi:MAG TPA: hypothetical protein PLO89_12015, partial [Spirochaetota bacterium]|nr:hypothetical protein [Spirochaetota bacterium]
PAGGILASKSLITKIEGLSFENIEFKNYILKGKDKQIEACLIYDYYVLNPKIMDDLLELRKNIENEIG